MPSIPVSYAVALASVGPPPGLPNPWTDAPVQALYTKNSCNTVMTGQRSSVTENPLANFPKGIDCLHAAEGLPILLTTNFVAQFMDAGVNRYASEMDGKVPDSFTQLDVWNPFTTSIMIRNIPNRYKFEELLVELIQRNFLGTFDFLYLPVDFRTKKNRGYAFINLIAPDHTNRFRRAFHGQQLKMYSTKKVLELAPATVQGFTALANSFARKKVGLVKNPWFRPMVFTVSGNGITWDVLGNEDAFLVGKSILWESVSADSVFSGTDSQTQSTKANTSDDDSELCSIGSEDETFDAMQSLEAAVRKFLRDCKVDAKREAPPINECKGGRANPDSRRRRRGGDRRNRIARWGITDDADCRIIQ